MFWTIISSLVVSYVVIYIYKFWRNVSHFTNNGIPCEQPWPIFGNLGKALLRKRHFSQIILDTYRLTPAAKYTGFFDFSNPVVVVRDLDLIKNIAVKNWESFLDHRGFVDEEVEPLFGKNLFQLKGQRWHDVRTLLSPAFTSSKMKSMFHLMITCAEDFVDFIAERSKKGQDIVELKDVFTRYTNDVIATCAFGIQINSMREPNNEFYVLGRRATNFDGILSLKFFVFRNFPWIVNFFKARVFDEKITNFFTDIISTTVATRDQQKIIRSDMLQLMMDARGKANELDIDEMTSQAFTFFLGGFETSSTLMCFVAHEIAVNPEIHRKLQEEVDAVWAKTQGNPNYDAINEMKYLDAIINETLRMYPPALFVDRMCTKEFELPPTLPGCKPYKVKPGDNLWFPVYGLHHDPDYFPEPNKFDPERFYQNKVPHHAFMPFGLGPRICIGNRFALLEVKAVLFQLMARCNLKVTTKTHVPMKISMNSFMLLADSGFWIKIEPRKNSNVGLFQAAKRNGSISA